MLSIRDRSLGPSASLLASFERLAHRDLIRLRVNAGELRRAPPTILHDVARHFARLVLVTGKSIAWPIARRSRRTFVQDARRLGCMPFVGSVYWLRGERARARDLLREMKRHPDVREDGMRVAWLHAQFSEEDSAFVRLERQRWSSGASAPPASL